MSAGFSVFTKISGDDALSPVFRKIGESAKAAMSPVTAFNKAVGEPNTHALGRVGSAIDGLAGKFKGAVGSAAGLLPALGALGAVGSIGGLISMTKGVAEGFRGISLAAEKLGMTTKDLSVFRYGAKQAGVESETMEKGMVKLLRGMGDAAVGKNKDVAALFKELNIPLKDAKGNVRSVSDVMPQLADAFKNTGNESMKVRMAVALFGRAGADLIPMLNKGAAGIEENRQELAKYGGLTKENFKNLDSLATAYIRFDKVGSGLSAKLAAVFAPSLEKVINFTSDWILANKELLAQSLDRKLDGIGKAFQFIAKIGTSIVSIPLIGEFLKGADVGTAFDIALIALGGTMAGPLFAALSMVVGSIWRMNAALYANPWVILAAAIAFAAYAIYENWGPIVDWFDDQMEAINAAFDVGFGSGLAAIFLRFNPASLLAAAMQGLSEWLFGFDLFPAGARLLQRLLDGIKSLLPDFEKMWAPIDKAMSFVGNRVSTGAAALNADTAAFGTAGDFNGGMFGMAPSPAAQAIAQVPKVESTINVQVGNAPPGTTVGVQSSGAVGGGANTGVAFNG